jgi:Fe-S-cluster containining protein
MTLESTNPCRRCGACCVEFSVGTERTGLVLAPRELREYLAETKRRGLLVEYSEEEILGEERHKKNLVLSYRVTTEPCVFYSPTGCAIYAARPFVCRAFPVRCWGAGGKGAGKDTQRVEVSSLCPAASDFSAAIADAHKAGKLHPALVDAKVYQIASETVVSFLVQLGQRGTLKLAEHRLQHTPSIDVDTFLAGIGHPLPITSTREIFEHLEKHQTRQ